MGAELSWHFFFVLFFWFGVGFLAFSLFFQQFSSIFQLFSLVFQRFSSIFHSSLWFSSAFHQFSIVFKNFLAFPSVFLQKPKARSQQPKKTNAKKIPLLHFVIIWYYSFWQLNRASTTRGMVCTEWQACKSMQERLLIQDRPERAGWSKSDTTVTVFSSSPEGSGKTRLWQKARIVRRVKSAIHHIIQY